MAHLNPYVFFTCAKKVLFERLLSSVELLLFPHENKRIEERLSMKTSKILKVFCFYTTP
jgi:hypothetical protein